MGVIEIDSDADVVFNTFEEAIAYALDLSRKDGSSVILHDVGCKAATTGCTCEPLTLTAGAEA